MAARFLQRFLGRPDATARPAALRIALIADDLTHCALKRSFAVTHIRPAGGFRASRFNGEGLLLVESAWRGLHDDWKYKIASYPDVPERNNRALREIVVQAREAGIPTVFWNKEDGVHFDRFIDSATLFDAVMTVDENCLPAYRERLGPHVKLGVMPFAIEPALHHPGPRGPTCPRASFVGSYSRHIHSQRRQWQDMMFRAAAPLGVTAYDRNSDRRHTDYRFPVMPWLDVRKCVPHEATARIYQDHMVSLNVNTVEDSPTMFSRRLIEILACAGLAVTNPSPAVDRHFRDFCSVVRDEEECRAMFERLRKDGLSRQDRDRAMAGAEHVRRHHTWAHRLAQLMQVIG
jgi:hypothetical protein